MYCKYCGNNLVDDAKFCSGCGAAVDNNKETNTQNGEMNVTESTIYTDNLTDAAQKYPCGLNEKEFWGCIGVSVVCSLIISLLDGVPSSVNEFFFWFCLVEIILGPSLIYFYGLFMGVEPEKKEIDKRATTTTTTIETTEHGTVINNITVTSNRSIKNKWLAFFLCLFFGALGIHRFYVGKIGTGLIYLCTLGLLGVGVVIDLVIILVGGFKDCNGYLLS